MATPAHSTAMMPPPPAGLTDEGLARYEQEFREQYREWAAILERNAERLARGQ